MHSVTFFAITCLMWALVSSAKAQSGIYTETVCSCSLFPPSGSQCLRMVSEGMCRSDACDAGYKCDLSGSELCARGKCGTLVATGSTSGSTFACTRQETECVTETRNAVILMPTPTPEGCLFTDTECSCSQVSASPGTCVRLSALASGAKNAKCVMGDCSAGYKCDCNGTDRCTRKACKQWAVSTDNPTGVLKDSFNCFQIDNTCVTKKQP